MPVGERQTCVGACPDLPGGHDVQHGDGGDPVGVIQRHPVGDAASTVVTGHCEALMAEHSHGLHLVVGQRALGVRDVVGRRRRAKRRPVAGQIRRHDSEPPGEQRRRRVPHQVRLRIAMQQQQGWPAAADTGEDRPPLGQELMAGEVLEHPTAPVRPPHRPARARAGKSAARG